MTLRTTTALLALALSLTLPASVRADPAAVRDALQRGEYAVAEQSIRALRPNERAQGDRLLARVLLETGRYDDALALGQRMARAATNRVEGLTVQAEALLAKGEYTEGLARLAQVLDGPGGATAWRARALACFWRWRTGDGDGSREAGNALIDAYNDATEAEQSGRRAAVLHDAEFLTAVGTAARAMGAVRNANEAYNEALRIDRTRVETNLAQAELMFSTEDLGPAGEALTAVLRANPHHAKALVARARVRLTSELDFVRASDDLDAALRVNPRLAEAYALRASIVLRDGDVAGAERLLDQGAAINPRDLDVLTMRGVVRFYANDEPGLRRAFDALFAVAPTYAEAYDALGDFADWEHRYAEVIPLLREGLERPALARDRRLGARIRAALGINLLRMGREDEGLAELRASFEGSRFNVRVANLLNFYEQTVGAQYVTDEAGPFRIRYLRDEAPVLRRYVPALLRRAYDDMVRRYGFTPEGPLSIELYADAEHFSVRTAGLPEIGVQGVCFGRVVTALSPRGGPFNWAQILWHELAHVFAIQRSRSRVPRWFTEGLSEWEAFHSHPEWSREDDPALAAALAADRLPRVADFNTAFTHARHADEMLTAYYAASQLVAFMIERWGFDRVVAMLPLWGEGRATPDVIERALGVSAEVVDREFRASLQPRLARYARAFSVDPARYRDRAALDRAAEASPESASAHSSAAAAALFDGDPQRAAALAERAVRLDGRDPVAHWIRARLAMAAHQPREALDELDALTQSGRDGFELRMMESAAARALRDDARTERALRAARELDPSQVEAAMALASLYQRTHREEDRLRALRDVVRLDQHNREALRALLDALVAARLWRDVVALREHATNLDPESLAVQFALGAALTETGDRNGAVEAYETALALAPPDAAAVRARIEAVRRGQPGLAPLAAPRANPREGD